jgi:phosphoribosylglycinamide formyltransferase-1
VVSAPLLEAFPDRILNIHPALLPAFPGLHGPAQALAHGVRIAGATVHLVDAGMDTGPIVAQGAVPVLPDDDEDALAQRILTRVEHVIYPRVLRWAAEGRLVVERAEGVRPRVRVLGDADRFVFAAC